MKIVTKSSRVIAAFPKVDSRNEVRYVIVERIHIAAISP